MKILTQSQVLAILENEQQPSIADEHLDAVRHEERLRLHSETRLRIHKGRHRALNEFLVNVPQNLLPAEKYQMFLNLLTNPLPTVEVVDAAYNELFKLFFGQNRVIDFRFSQDEEFLQKDWMRYRKDNGFADWFRFQGWNVFKNHINAPLVVDLPELVIDNDGVASMATERPEPFFFFVPTENVVDLWNDHHNICHYLIYQNDAPRQMQEQQQIDKIAYYVDSERYATYVRKTDQQWQFAAEAPHDLGFTPAQSFWNKPLRNSTFQRQNPITPNLGALDWMLYSIISKRNLDLFAGFPIVSVYEQQCNYKNSDGFECNGGEIEHYTSIERQGTVSEPCPKCSQNQMLGPGSTIVLPLPDPESESNVNLMPGVQITPGDVNSQKQMNNELDRQRKEFMIHVTGFDNSESELNAPSKNNQQLRSDTESRHNIIMELKEGFETIEKFILDTTAKLRYGDAYQGSVVNYGSQFFLKSFQEMQNDYALAKENGIPSFELSNMRKEIYQKKYSSDPKILSRMMLLGQLEPYPDYTVVQLQGLLAFIDPEELALKIAFNDLINRFEREFGPVDQYFTSLDIEIRVELITAKLKGFLSQMDISFETLTQNNGTESVSQQEIRQE